MGLLELASSASDWRGYEYYKEKAIITKHKISDTKYEGTVRGSGNNHYDVFMTFNTSPIKSYNFSSCIKL